MTDTSPQQDLQSRYGRPPTCVIRAPGRVNLIGDHTDYNDGFVLPFAIDLGLNIAAAPRDDRRVRVHSAPLNESLELPPTILDGAGPNAPAVGSLPRWGRYVAGVAALAARLVTDRDGRDAVIGADVLITGDLPAGAGLSSSAALEVGVAKALLELWKRAPTDPQDHARKSARAQARGSLPDPVVAVPGEHPYVRADLSDLELAALCRKAENDYAGAPCGVMDQLCCIMARAGHALLIDCESIKTRHVPLNLGDARIVVIDTGVRHAIAAGEYARRRLDCELAVRTLNRLDPHITSLRKLSAERLDMYAAALGAAVAVDQKACDDAAAIDPATIVNPKPPQESQRCDLDDSPPLARRVRHVVTENRRVRHAVLALERGDVRELGRLMSESHRSLRGDYEVSCPELDAAVEIAESIEGVYGARMTGGGFGGCAIALAEPAAVNPLADALTSRYDARFPAPSRIITVSSTGGAEKVSG